MEGALITKQFQDLNIQVYGTHDEPLFRAKDIGELLGIDQIRKTIQSLDDDDKIIQPGNSTTGFKEQYFLTENGLYEVLFISRKPIAKSFKKWVKEVIKEIRLKGKYDIEEQLRQHQQMIEQVQSELNRYKQSDYEQVEYTGFVYVISTDKAGVYKIGRTKNIKNRTSKLQTNSVDDIQVVYQFPTSNEKILEDAIHYVLDRYRTNSNREHFRVDKDYIITMLKVIGNTIDTSKSCCHNIEHGKLVALLTDGLLKEPEHSYSGRELQDELYIEEVANPQDQVDTEEDEFVADEQFWNWLDNSIEHSDNKCVIKLIDIVNLYTDDYSFSKFNSQIMAHYKTQFQEYVRVKFPRLRSFQHTIRYNGKTYKGWSHIKFAHA